jgi:serine protease Do
MRNHAISTVAAMLVMVGLGLPAVANEKNHARILAAFRPVVQDATKSTVRVFSDGKRAALGTVVDSEGYIITKASELKGALEVQTIDGRRTGATIVGVDRKLDLAMLKVELKELPPIRWADGDEKIERGAWLVTPGLERDPIGIGVVSAEQREIQRASGALGVELQDSPGSGAGIRRIFPKTPAEEAGLQPGDVVTHVFNKPIDSLTMLKETISSYEPGDEVEITVRRGRESFDARLTLGNFQQMIQGERAEFQNSLGGQLSQRRAGFALVLQHDTVLKPQDCGGPVLDVEGRAVGINIARAGRVETYALAASIIKPILDDMKAGKYAPDSMLTGASSASRQ